MILGSIVQEWENFPPIRWGYHQLPTKTGHLQSAFERFSRVRSNESSEAMERAMGSNARPKLGKF